jgi:hypothetical protein
VVVVVPAVDVATSIGVFCLMLIALAAIFTVAAISSRWSNRKSKRDSRTRHS